MRDRGRGRGGQPQAQVCWPSKTEGGATSCWRRNLYFRTDTSVNLIYPKKKIKKIMFHFYLVIKNKDVETEVFRRSMTFWFFCSTFYIRNKYLTRRILKCKVVITYFFHLILCKIISYIGMKFKKEKKTCGTCDLICKRKMRS